jgi:hypothetical protein
VSRNDTESDLGFEREGLRHGKKFGEDGQ